MKNFVIYFFNALIFFLEKNVLCQSFFGGFSPGFGNADFGFKRNTGLEIGKRSDTFGGFPLSPFEQSSSLFQSSKGFEPSPKLEEVEKPKTRKSRQRERNVSSNPALGSRSQEERSKKERRAPQTPEFEERQRSTAAATYEDEVDSSKLQGQFREIPEDDPDEVVDQSKPAQEYFTNEPTKSEYKITYDGKTPFQLDNSSKIVYGADGMPEEIVVFKGESRELHGSADDPAGSFGTCCGKKKKKGYGKAEYKSYGHEVEHSSGYGHDDHHGGGYGHDDHGGGYHDDHGSHGGGYGHDDHGGYGHDDHGHVPNKKPGPFGYGSPNYKCEYAKETLYVTKTDYKQKKKCFHVFKKDCKHKYDTGKDVGYKKDCNEFSETKCRTVYKTDFKTKCKTVYKKKCKNSYEYKVDWKYKEECTTTYKKKCSGYGYHKSCHDVPKEKCKQIPVKVEKKVPKTTCKKVPRKKCKDVPFFIPKKECKDFPKTICTSHPINVKKSVPKKVCFAVPKQKCISFPVEFLVHVPKTVKKKVCVSTKVAHGGYGSSGHGGGYGHDDHGGGGYHDDHSSGGYGHDDHGGGYSHDAHGGYGGDDHGGYSFDSFDHGSFEAADIHGGYDAKALPIEDETGYPDFSSKEASPHSSNAEAFLQTFTNYQEADRSTIGNGYEAHPTLSSHSVNYAAPASLSSLEIPNSDFKISEVFVYGGQKSGADKNDEIEAEEQHPLMSKRTQPQLAISKNAPPIHDLPSFGSEQFKLEGLTGYPARSDSLQIPGTQNYESLKTKTKRRTSRKTRTRAARNLDPKSEEKSKKNDQEKSQEKQNEKKKKVEPTPSYGANFVPSFRFAGYESMKF